MSGKAGQAPLKELEKENARLQGLVADQALDIDMLKEVKRANPPPLLRTTCEG